ncbi:MAG: sigma-70 family RNA polymerase sigma factor [Verrucomicrobiota bacterium]
MIDDASSSPSAAAPGSAATPEDSELLRRYAEERSETAFAELVQRRIGLVYSVALRQTRGNRHRAEDATQAVFADLARKASTLARRPVLAGWLYRSAQFAAIDLVRADARRQAREQTAHFMQTDLAPTHSAADWEKVRPVLDQALNEIDETDRDAILLRFFDNRPFADIGARLRLSENAARMRVERALDKLSATLSRRGVTSTAAALGLALGGQIGTAAPAGLAASVTTAALAPITAAAGAASLTSIFALGKFQLGLAAAVATGGIALFAVQSQTHADLRREIAATRPEPHAIATLRAENQRLAAQLAEVESLQRDVTNITRLEQSVAEARQAVAQRQALAAQAQQQSASSLQAQLDRINKEGNALVKDYKTLAESAKNPALDASARQIAEAAAAEKLAAVKAKMEEKNTLMGKPNPAAVPTDSPAGKFYYTPGKITAQPAPGASPAP